MLWKKATLLGLAGFAAGALISIGFGLAGSPDGRLNASFSDMLAGGLFSAVMLGSSIMYEIESWSIARATATHFLLAFGLYFLVVRAMGWFSLDDPVFWTVVAVMAAGYVLVWLFQYLAYRRKIREMNEDLEKWKSGEARKDCSPRN